MRTTIDAAGRVVIPKAMRERMGLAAGGEVELHERDTGVEVSPAPVVVRVERRGDGPVLTADVDEPMTDDQVRDLVERVRR